MLGLSGGDIEGRGRLEEGRKVFRFFLGIFWTLWWAVGANWLFLQCQVWGICELWVMVRG